MRITLKDIAKASGFSVTAVSRALNSKDGVSEQTRRKIQGLAKNMGYVPNVVARSLRTKTTKTLGVIFEDITKPYFAQMIKGIDDVAKNSGYDIFVCNTNLDPVQELRMIRKLLERLVDGVILHPSQLSNEGVEMLQSSGIPFVTISRRLANLKTNFVICDNYQGIQMMFNYLFTQGCRDVLFINSPLFTSPSRDRMEGYKEALKQNGLNYRRNLVKISKASVDEAYATMIQTISDGEIEFDSVLCGRDEIAIGVLEALLENGYRVPDDIRVTGYDDLRRSRYVKVPLTTIHQPVYEVGQKSAELVIGLITKEISGDRLHELVLSPQLIIRDSA